MALRNCSDEELHTAHRWPKDEHEPFCPGRHDAESGQWLADRSRRHRGLSGRVHFYLPDAPRSICGYGRHETAMLGFDPATSMTTEDDPRLGEAQYRTACVHCSRAVVPRTQGRA